MTTIDSTAPAPPSIAFYIELRRTACAARLAGDVQLALIAESRAPLMFWEFPGVDWEPIRTACDDLAALGALDADWQDLTQQTTTPKDHTMTTQSNTLAPYQASVKVAQQALDNWEIDADSDEVICGFRDMLSDEYGSVDVCYIKMDASKVLEECDPIAFREGLLDYVDGLDRGDFADFRDLAEALEAAEAALAEAEDALDKAD